VWRQWVYYEAGSAKRRASARDRAGSLHMHLLCCLRASVGALGLEGARLAVWASSGQRQPVSSRDYLRVPHPKKKIVFCLRVSAAGPLPLHSGPPASRPRFTLFGLLTGLRFEHPDGTGRHSTSSM
jgi:hypothetical protein